MGRRFFLNTCMNLSQSPLDSLVTNAAAFLERRICGRAISKLLNMPVYAVTALVCIGEVVWSDARQRHLENFLTRLNAHYPRFDALKVKYRHPSVSSGQ